MGIASNESKQRWNAAHYTQVKVSVAPEIAEAFKAYCTAAGVSMASEISNFMSGQNRATLKNKTTQNTVGTRQQRRRVIKRIIQEVEAVMDAEQQYMDNIPANLQSSRIYEAAEQTVSTLEEALNILNEAY